jgi:hypothetical protein
MDPIIIVLVSELVKASSSGYPPIPVGAEDGHDGRRYLLHRQIRLLHAWELTKGVHRVLSVHIETTAFVGYVSNGWYQDGYSIPMMANVRSPSKQRLTRIPPIFLNSTTSPFSFSTRA